MARSASVCETSPVVELRGPRIPGRPLACSLCESPLDPHCDDAGCDLARCVYCHAYGTLDQRLWRPADPEADSAGGDGEKG